MISSADERIEKDGVGPERTGALTVYESPRDANAWKPLQEARAWTRRLFDYQWLVKLARTSSLLPDAVPYSRVWGLGSRQRRSGRVVPLAGANPGKTHKICG